jgi:chromate reductase
MSTLVLTASLRAASNTTMLGDLLVTHGVDASHAARLDELAFFNQDLEEDPPAAVTRLRSQIDEASLVVIVTPEYNGVVPGLLGNAIDWLSRPYGDGALQHKRVVAVAASPGARGGMRALEVLHQLLTNVGANVVATAAVGEVDQRLSRGRSDDVLSDVLSVLHVEARLANGSAAA